MFLHVTNLNGNEVDWTFRKFDIPQSVCQKVFYPREIWYEVFVWKYAPYVLSNNCLQSSCSHGSGYAIHLLCRALVSGMNILWGNILWGFREGISRRQLYWIHMGLWSWLLVLNDVGMYSISSEWKYYLGNEWESCQKYSNWWNTFMLGILTLLRWGELWWSKGRV